MVPSLQRCLFVTAFAVMIAASAGADCLLPSWSAGSVVSRTADALIAIDLTGDAKPEIVGKTATAVFVLPNDGTGAFSGWSTIYTGTVAGPIGAADFNGDGAIDLAFGSTNAIVFLPGFGNGSFGPARTTSVAITPTNLAVASLDGDAWPDLLVHDAILGVLVRYVSDGNGYFAESSRTSIAANAAALTVGDFDGDTRPDAVVGYDGANYDAFFGEAGGTFGSPLIVRGTPGTIVLRTADVDHSGLPDLIGGTWDGGVAILRNLGNRTFSDPLGLWDTWWPMFDLEVADFTGDGYADAATVNGRCLFKVWRGSGVGTFNRSGPMDINNTSCYEIDAGDLAPGDFDGDGRVDLAVATRFGTQSSIRVFRNSCGDGTLTASLAAPVVSVGDSANVVVTFNPALPSYGFSATGAITIRENGATVGTGSFASYGPQTVTVPGLAAGSHTLVAAWEGNEQFEPAESNPVTVTMTTAITTVTITVTPEPVQYGIAPQISATVTSTTGQPLTGRFVIRIDGYTMAEGSGPTLPVNGYYSIPTSVGAHTIVAEYSGDSANPPARKTKEYVVVRQTPRIGASKQSGTDGVATPLNVLVQNNGGGSYPTGTVALSIGQMALGMQTLGATWPSASFTVPALPAGRHFLMASYSGDANYAAVDTALPFVVFPATGEWVDARGALGGVTVTWQTDKLIIERKLPNEAWPGSGGSCCPSQPWLDSSALKETVYLYRIEGHGGGWTEPDLGMRIVFADDPLLPGMSIRAAHLQEIVRAVNIVRTAAQLAPISAEAFQIDRTIMASDVLAIRTAINQARAALGAYAYPFAGVIAAGAPVRAADIQELREAVR